ncbi:MAG: hypothetical protein Q4F09_01190 [Erysipelotrichaceae bacterium]|nr:hypothetical protein [Erysipelotrichaceae bacterium]
MNKENVELTPVLQSWRSDREDLFGRFCEELEQWFANGSEPFDGDQDIRYLLDLQEKRLKEHQIEARCRLIPRGTPPMQASKVLSGSLSAYNRSTHYRSFEEELEFFRKGEKLYQHKKDLNVYLSIIEPEKGEKDIGESAVSCPNCGNIAKVSELLQSGCPFCHTHFVYKDLFPKVTNYYAVETVPAPEVIEKKAKQFPLAGAVIGAVFGMISCILAGWLKNGILGFLGALLFSAFTAGIFAFIAYMFYSFLLLGKVLKMAGKSLPMVSAIGSDKKLDKALSAYDPSFNTEYFSGKAMSMFRTIVFSRDPQDLPQYSGGKLDERFADMIHCTSKGAVGVRSINEKDGYLEVELELFLTDFYDRGNKVKRAEDRILMTMRHNAEFRIKDTFTFSAAACPNCGGSFNVLKEKYCPYCHSRFESSREDWEVTSVRYR